MRAAQTPIAHVSPCFYRCLLSAPRRPQEPVHYPRPYQGNSTAGPHSNLYVRNLAEDVRNLFPTPGIFLPRRHVSPACRREIDAPGFQQVDDALLNEVFAAFGPVENATVWRDPTTGRCCGFGFVKLSSTQQAAAAIAQLNGHVLAGKALEARLNPLPHPCYFGPAAARAAYRYAAGGRLQQD